MRKINSNLIVTAVLFILACSFIEWDKEAIKACITGVVFSWALLNYWKKS